MLGRWLGDGWKDTCCIRTPHTTKTISTTQRPYSTHKSQHQMVGWLALAISKTVCCESTSPRDGCEIAGWLALAISTDYGCHFGSLGDGWKMAGRTPRVLEHPIQQRPSVQHKIIQYKSTNQNQMAGWLAVAHFTNFTNFHKFTNSY